MKLNTIGKAVEIIHTIQRARRPLSIKEIAETMGFNKSSLHHHVKTLTTLQFLQKDPETRKYDIGLGLVQAGQSYLQRIDVKDRGHCYLEELSRVVRESVHMLVLDGTRATYVDRVDGEHRLDALRCACLIGVQVDVHSTAAGKVLLAHLDRNALETVVDGLSLRRLTEHTITDKAALLHDLSLVRNRGYALNVEEHVLGVHAVAVPVFNHHAQCVASISVSCAVGAVSQKTLETDVLHKLHAAGRKISMAIGYTPR